MTDSKSRPDITYGRTEPIHRYESASTNLMLRAPRFNKPRISGAAAERLKQALNNSPALKKGEKHEAVKVLQQALIDLQDFRISIPDGATGYYGDQTVAAVQAFQNLMKLVRREGSAGNETLGRLDRFYVDDPPVDEDVLLCPRAHSIPRFIQPKGEGSCWAAGAAMMYFWKHDPKDVPVPVTPDVRIRYMLQRTKTDTAKWIQTYEGNEGLPNRENRKFFGDALGMQVTGSSSTLFDTGFYTSKLRNGPVALNTVRRPGGGGDLRNHVIVVFGIKPVTKDGSVLLVIDPFDGQDHEASTSFIASALGWADNPWVPGKGTLNVPPETQFRDRAFFW